MMIIRFLKITKVRTIRMIVIMIARNKRNRYSFTITIIIIQTI